MSVTSHLCLSCGYPGLSGAIHITSFQGAFCAQNPLASSFEGSIMGDRARGTSRASELRQHGPVSSLRGGHWSIHFTGLRRPENLRKRLQYERCAALHLIDTTILPPSGSSTAGCAPGPAFPTTVSSFLVWASVILPCPPRPALRQCVRPHSRRLADNRYL